MIRTILNFFIERRKINRVEIIGTDGREYVRHLSHHQTGKLKFQDDDKTLKVFVEVNE